MFWGIVFMNELMNELINLFMKKQIYETDSSY